MKTLLVLAPLLVLIPADALAASPAAATFQDRLAAALAPAPTTCMTGAPSLAVPPLQDRLVAAIRGDGAVVRTAQGSEGGVPAALQDRLIAAITR